MKDLAVESVPAPGPLPPSPRHGLWRWVSTVDHKEIGILYLWASLIFFAIGGVEALLIRIQLAVPGNHFLTPETYDQFFTMHGTTMIFLVANPVLFGLANYIVPLMIGARDMAFPRLNALSVWFLYFGGFLLYYSFAAGGAPDAGWFSYAPLSGLAYNPGRGIDYWAFGLLLIGLSTVATSVNLIATVITMRTPGMHIRRLPLFAWMMLVDSILAALALPALNASLVMLLVDRYLRGGFFNPALGGSAVLWQHFFWSFGHPEVYIVILPAFGIFSEVIPVFSRKAIFGYEFVALSSVAIAVLSFAVWAHHMFAVDLGHTFDSFFVLGSMAIAVPTGVKIFNWIATMWKGVIHFTAAMWWAIAFLISFTIGGLSGVAFAVAPIDWQMTDTYFVVAHLHFVFIGGTVFGALAGITYWFPKMAGRMLSERLGKWTLVVFVLGFYLTFFDQHLLGIMGMPRRVFTYPNLPGWGAMNMVSTVGAFVMGLGSLMFLWNLLISYKRGQPVGDNPWNAWTLEWATSSPPPPENFRRIPPVRSRRPLWDLAHPDDPDEIRESGEMP